MTYVLALGTNIGNRKENIDNAVESINLVPKTSVIACSSIYETEPVGYDEQDDVYQNRRYQLKRKDHVHCHEGNVGCQSLNATQIGIIGILRAFKGSEARAHRRADGQTVQPEHPALFPMQAAEKEHGDEQLARLLRHGCP